VGVDVDGTASGGIDVGTIIPMAMRNCPNIGFEVPPTKLPAVSL